MIEIKKTFLDNCNYIEGKQFTSDCEKPTIHDIPNFYSEIPN